MPSRRRLLQGVVGTGAVVGGLQVTGLYDVTDWKGCPSGIDPSWNRDLGGLSGPSPPRFLNGSIFVVDEYRLVRSTGDPVGRLHRLDGETGDTEWTFPSSEYGMGRPRVTEQRVVVGTADDHVYALDPETGSDLWSRDVTGSTLRDAYVFHEPVRRSGRLVVGAGDAARERGTAEGPSGRVLGLDPATGEAHWATPTEYACADVRGLGEDVLVVTSDYRAEVGELLRVGAREGRRAWATELARHVHEALVIGDSAVARSPDAAIGVETATGRVRWTVPVPGSSSNAFTALCRDAGRDLAILGTRHGEVMALDTRSGAVTWRASAYPGSVPDLERSTVAVGALAVTSASVVALTRRGRLVRIDAEDGTVRSRRFLLEPSHNGADVEIECTAPWRPSGLGIAAGDLVVPTDDRGLYRFSSSSF